MSSPWWAAFGPVETEISCSSGQHSVLWADGALHAVEHPDADGELVLAALGSEAAPCLDLVRTWERHADDLVVLSLAPRSADDLLTITTAEIDELTARQYPSGWSRRVTRLGGYVTPHGGSTFTSGWAGGPTAPQGRSVIGGPSARLVLEGDPGRHEVLRLLALSAPLQQRLSGAVAHEWSAQGPHHARADRARPALTAALTGRLAPAVARWLDIDLTQIDAALHTGSGWGAMELDGLADDSRLKVRLPVSWLARVWAPGLAVVDGHFVASIQHASWPTAQVVAIREPGRHPVELAVRYESSGWTTAGR